MFRDWGALWEPVCRARSLVLACRACWPHAVVCWLLQDGDGGGGLLDQRSVGLSIGARRVIQEQRPSSSWGLSQRFFSVWLL